MLIHAKQISDRNAFTEVIPVQIQMAAEFGFLVCSAGITRFCQHLENFRNDLIWSWIERGSKKTSIFSPETKEPSLSQEVGQVRAAG